MHVTITIATSDETGEVYLHRSKYKDARLNAWVTIGGATLALSLAEVPQLIAALDEAMEKAEFVAPDATGTVWRRDLRLAPAEGDAG